MMLQTKQNRPTKSRKSFMVSTALIWATQHCLSELESSMSSVQIGQKSYEMPPREGSVSRIFSPSPTSSDRLATTKRSSPLAF